jgi:hypothetical protein
MGKSSILKHLARLLGEEFIPTTLDLQLPGTLDNLNDLLLYLSETISDALRLRFLTIEPLTKNDLSSKAFRAFDRWLAKVEQALPDGKRVLLCLDEYEMLQKPLAAGWGSDVLDLLRNVTQHRTRIVLMFTGANTFAELGAVWTDKFIGARRIRVNLLTLEETRELLTRPVPELRYAEDGALELILTTTNGQPNLTQAIAHQLIELLNTDKRQTATADDSEQAIRRALESAGEYFANVWYDARAEGQAILRAVANGETPPDYPSARNWLFDRNLLDSNNQFVVPMVGRWVREHSARLPQTHN